MTILTTTENRTIDSTTRDVHFRSIDVGALVEEHTLIALSGTKEIAGNGVSSNLSEGAGYAKRGRATEGDGSSTSRNTLLLTHIRQLVTAIDVRQDMTTSDGDIGVTIHRTCRPQPLACSVGEGTATATKHITVIGMTVRTDSGTAFRVVTASEWIVGLIFLFSSSIDSAIYPMWTFCHCCCRCFDVRCTGTVDIDEGSRSIGCRLSCTATYLTAIDIYMGIVQYMTILCSAIDGTLDKGTITYGDISLVYP